MKPVVDLVYFDAGGGHRAAAAALRDTLLAQGRPWTVRLVHLTEVLDPRQHFRRLTGMAPEDLYNGRLRRGWTRGMATELAALQAGIRLAQGLLVRRLARHWARTAPDLVVSLIPNFNRAMAEALAQARPGVPFVTVMTDLADLPPEFWGVPDTAQHLVCGTPQALAQALENGHARERLTLVSGMLLRPAFHAQAPLDAQARAQARRAAALDPAQPAAVVMFGGQGSAQMLRIAAALPELPLILMTGHNTALAERLRRQRAAAPRVVVGHTQDVAHWLQLADVFIGKPGPGSLSEALHLGLPVITFLNGATMPQERFNAHWIAAQGLGCVLHSPRGLPQACATLLADLDGYRARVAALDNRAVFEVADLLAHLLAQAPQRSRALVATSAAANDATPRRTRLVARCVARLAPAAPEGGEGR